MPRHEPVSPEEDLAAYYGPGGGPGAGSAAGPGAGPVVATSTPPAAAGSPPPPVPSGPPGAVPPPIPPGLAVPPSWPADGFEPAPGTGSSGPPPGRLAPVQRPTPTFGTPTAMVADAPNPVVAAVVSLFVPGAGQIYAGQTAKGVVVMILAFATCFGGGLFNVLAAIDAWLIAQRRARGENVDDWQFF